MPSKSIPTIINPNKKIYYNIKILQDLNFQKQYGENNKIQKFSPTSFLWFILNCNLSFLYSLYYDPVNQDIFDTFRYIGSDSALSHFPGISRDLLLVYISYSKHFFLNSLRYSGLWFK